MANTFNEIQMLTASYSTCEQQLLPELGLLVQANDLGFSRKSSCKQYQDRFASGWYYHVLLQSQYTIHSNWSPHFWEGKCVCVRAELLRQWFPFLLLILKVKGLGRGLSSYEYLLLVQRTQVPLPTSTWQLITLCNSSSKDLVTIAGLRRNCMYMYLVHIHTCRWTLIDRK